MNTILAAAALAMAAWLVIVPRSAPGRTPERRPASSARPVTRHRLLRAVNGKLRRSSASADATAVASWCDALARELRAGTTLREALHATTPADERLRAVTAPLRLALARGRSTPEAVATLDGGAQVEFVRQVLATTARHGGPAARALDDAAAVLRLRVADRAERAVHAAQARLSAHVLTAIPVALIGVVVAADPDVRDVVRSPPGAICIVVGLALNVVGWWWMHRVTGADR